MLELGTYPEAPRRYGYGIPRTDFSEEIASIILPKHVQGECKRDLCTVKCTHCDPPKPVTEMRTEHTALDLPPIHTHPRAPTLLSVLRSLALRPPAFERSSCRSDGNDRGGGGDDDDDNDGDGNGDDNRETRSAFDNAGIPRYLTSIISSRLDWISSEAVREEIWEMASTRLSERAGRTGEVHLCISSRTLSDREWGNFYIYIFFGF